MRAGGDGPATDRQMQADLDAAAAGMPAATVAEVTRIGVAVIRADLTGTGRERFPGYWPPANNQATAGPQVVSFTVNAAGARPLNEVVHRVEVTVIWSGTSASGMRLIRQHNTVTLAWDPDSRTWRPQPG